MPSIEYSPNSRARCQSCRFTIHEGSIRVFTREIIPSREGETIGNWWHANCYTDRKDFVKFHGFQSLTKYDQNMYMARQQKEISNTEQKEKDPQHKKYLTSKYEFAGIDDEAIVQASLVRTTIITPNKSEEQPSLTSKNHRQCFFKPDEFSGIDDAALIAVDLSTEPTVPQRNSQRSGQDSAMQQEQGVCDEDEFGSIDDELFLSADVDMAQIITPRISQDRNKSPPKQQDHAFIDGNGFDSIDDKTLIEVSPGDTCSTRERKFEVMNHQHSIAAKTDNLSDQKYERKRNFSLVEEHAQCERSKRNCQKMNVKVVGRHHSAVDVNEGQMVKLIREPENAHDSNAIRVDDCDDNKVGYINRHSATKIAAKLDAICQRNLLIEAKILVCIDAFQVLAQIDFGRATKISPAAQVTPSIEKRTRVIKNPYTQRKKKSL